MPVYGSQDPLIASQSFYLGKTEKQKLESRKQELQRQLDSHTCTNEEAKKIKAEIREIDRKLGAYGPVDIKSAGAEIQKSSKPAGGSIFAGIKKDLEAKEAAKKAEAEKSDTSATKTTDSSEYWMEKLGGGEKEAENTADYWLG